MLGRARCFILIAFALAFTAQLAVVFLYLPSTSINNGLLLDESAFPASPAVRVTSKNRSANNSSAIVALQKVNHVKKPGVVLIPPLLPTPSAAVYLPSNPSIVLSPTAENPSLSASALFPNYDLIIGINTVARTGSPDYLLRTLRALRSAIEANHLRRIFVLVACPVDCNTHSVYIAARAEFESRASFAFLSVPPSQRFMDPTPLAPDPDDRNNPEDRPGKRVRQQTGDVITLLRALQTSPSPPSSYIMMMEDDFLICDGALDDMFRFIHVANSRSQRWMGVRASYGLNGIILQMRDAPLFESWLAKKISWKPPDILYTEWVAGVEGKSLHIGGIRPYYTAQFNLFQHIGTVSSLRQTGMGAFPGCKADLSPVLWDCEKFKSECKDISPC